MAKRCRITIQITHEQKERIESAIKSEYPRLKTVSDLVRKAIDGFLKESV